MRVLSTLPLFGLALGLYLLAAALALILSKKHRICTLVCNLICMLGAAAGIASALTGFFGPNEAATAVLSSTIPLLSFDLSIDTLSGFFILALSVLAFCVSLYSIGYMSHYHGKRNVGLFQFLYALFLFSMLLVFASGNAAFFLIAWEAMSALSYFLVLYESEKDETREASRLYLIMTVIGTAFLFLALLLLYRYTGSFDLRNVSSAIPVTAKSIMAVLLLLGFGTKAGIIPLHIWLPAAHPAAPGNVSALMSGIMIKTAIYGLLRFTLGVLGLTQVWWGVLLLCVGVVTAVLGVSYAFVENDMKKLLAYSSIENIGIILIGIGTGIIALANGNALIGSLAVAAALFHSFSHTLMKGCLFLGAGAVQFSTHTRNMEELGGLIKKLPVTALFVLCSSLAISAIIPFCGFAGEWLTLQSLFAAITPGKGGHNIALILAVASLALAGALAAASFAKLFGISFLGKPRSSHAEHAQPIPAVMNVAMGILASLCLLLGLFPALLLRFANLAVLPWTGQTILGQFSGFLLLRGDLFANAQGAVSPLSLLIALLLAIALTLLLARLIGGKLIVRKYGTWDCGFEALNARMQYSSTGFSKPVKIVFKALFRPARALKTDGGTPYAPERMEYTVSSESIIEQYLYAPLTRWIQRLSKRTKAAIQTGSIRRYLAYIFIALLALMLYNAIV